MHPRRFTLAILLLSGLSLGATPVTAARPVPQGRPLTATPRQIVVGTPSDAAPSCRMGVTAAPASTVGYIIPPDDSYYTLIDPADCECTEPGEVLVSAGHIVLDAWEIGPWPVRVGLVQADLSNPECPVPMPGQYLCPPVEYQIEAPDFAVYDFTLPLSEGYLITQKAFLEITFTEWGPWYTVPGLVLTGSCEPCQSYNYYPGDNYDLCTFGFDGNPVMYVDSACSGTVPVEADSWGRLKALYR